MRADARAKLLREYFDLNEEKKAIEKRLAEIKELAELNTPEIFVVDDDIVMEVKPRREFDAARAQRVLPPELFSQICVQKPSAALVKKYLTGEEQEALTKSAGVTVTWRKNV